VLVPVWPPPYTSTAEECADLCSKNDKCQAYTFNNGPDGHQGLVEDNKFQCWLKDKCEPLTNDPLATSGVCPTAATAIGDPHLVNTRGEHFSIFRSGQVEFIRVPYESVTEEADMTVHASIQSFGETDNCKEALYITGLRFGGSWFKGKPLEINVDFVRPGATEKEMKVLLGGVPVVPSTDPIDVGDKMALHMHDKKKIVLMVDGASVVVDQQYFFLNVKADSFSKLSQKFGGLLGEDDHSAFSAKPAGCEHELVAKAAQPVYSSASMTA
jgi:hypothetical protein